MRRLLGWLAVAAVVLAAGGRAEGQQAVPVVRPSATGAGQFETIKMLVPTLTEEQQAKLQAIADKTDVALLGNKQRKNKAVQTRDEVADDPAAFQAATDKLTVELQQVALERRELLAGSLTQMEAVLTPAQREQWQGYALLQMVMFRLRMAGLLTDEQQDQLAKLATAAAKDRAGAADPAGEAARRAVEGKLWKQVVGVLTDEQITRITGGTGIPRTQEAGGLMNGPIVRPMQVAPALPEGVPPAVDQLIIIHNDGTAEVK